MIVEAHKDARACREALAEAGIPAVYSGDLDIFSSQAAEDWLCLLEAFEQPHRSGLVRAAATTMFFGETAGQPARRRRRADRPDRRRPCAPGPTTSAPAAWPRCSRPPRSPGWRERVLAWRGGERDMTDLAHLAQLLHETAHRERFGLPALLDWLRDGGDRQRARGRAHPPARQRRRGGADHDRVGEQGAAVPPRLPAVRRSTGTSSTTTNCCCSTRTAPAASTSAARGAPGYTANEKRWRAEVAGDDIRLTYVALTRAQSQVVAWWAPSWDEVNGGISRLLRGRKQGDAVVPDSLDRASSDDEVLTWLRALAAGRRPGRRGVRDRRAGRARAPRSCPTGLGSRGFTREVDVAWRRTSYSGLIRAADQQAGGVASEHEDAELEDEVGRAGADPANVPADALALPDGRAAGRRHLRVAGARRARAGRPARARPATPSWPHKVREQLRLLARST